jgi:hypothetical protein
MLAFVLLPLLPTFREIIRQAMNSINLAEMGRSMLRPYKS